jgi:opacity protein-like surface antigen
MALSDRRMNRAQRIRDPEQWKDDVMSSFKKFAMASAAAGLAVTAANAADLPLAPVPIPVIQEFSGWYLRGDIGMTNQTVGSLTDYVAPGTSVGTKFLTFDSAPLFSLGGGYQFNNWLRMDVTGEYRGNAHFHGQQVGVFGTVSLPDDYNADKSEWLFLANAYVDLGTWWCVTPYLGAGIGTSRNSISSFTDIGATQAGLGGGSILSTTYGENASKWNLAWALYAGLAYKVAPGLSLELTYRYVNLGSATTGLTNSFDGVTVVNAPPFSFNNINSQDVMLGFRWNLGEPEVLVAPPIVRKG